MFRRTFRDISALLLGTVLLQASLPAHAAESQTAIPARFQGEWNDDVKHCGTDQSDSQLKIGPHDLHFLETSAAVRAVVTEGDTDLAVITEMKGEGETWLAFYHFVLSPDGNHLTDVSDPGAEPDLDLVRCPRGK